MSVRYSRQARLAEIGAEGQSRLAACEVVVSCSGIAGDIEARYLAAAGVGNVRARMDHAPVREGSSIEEKASRESIEEKASRESIEEKASRESIEESAALGIEDPSAREFALGAHAALRSIRRVVLRGAP